MTKTDVLKFPEPRKPELGEAVPSGILYTGSLDEVLQLFAHGEVFPNEAVSKKCKDLASKIVACGDLGRCLVYVYTGQFATLTLVQNPTTPQFSYKTWFSGADIRHKTITLLGDTYSWRYDWEYPEDTEVCHAPGIVLREHHFSDSTSSARLFNSRAEHLRDAEVFVGWEQVMTILSSLPDDIKHKIEPLFTVIDYETRMAQFVLNVEQSA